MELRRPSSSELKLLKFLINGADNCEIRKDLSKRLMVSDMSDGGMGSLRLHAEGSYVKEAHFGKEVRACQFTDEDGVDVIASLNLDQYGNLYELDIWKTDFGKLIRIPENQNELRLEKE